MTAESSILMHIKNNKTVEKSFGRWTIVTDKRDSRKVSITFAVIFFFLNDIGNKNCGS